MNTVRIRNAEDVRTLMVDVLHFHPSNSLVIMPVGGGPVARIDLGDLDDMSQGLAPAAPYWTNGVILALVTDDTGADVAAHTAMLDALGVRVLVAFTFPNPDDTATAREDLVTLAAMTEDAEDAERLAWDAYRAGDGALAWCYLDRHEALTGGAPSEAARDLISRLTNCVAPTA